MTKIIKGALLLILMIVVVKSNAQNVADTMVGKIFVARATFRGASVKGGGYAGVTKYSLNDVNTKNPIVVRYKSEWTCTKSEHSDYLLSDSGITISVTKTQPLGVEPYWYIKSNPLMSTGTLSIYAFTDKKIITARFRRDSTDKAQQDTFVAQETRNRLPDLIKKYGEVNAQKIYHNNIDTGFTEEMCEDAWADPLPESQQDSNVNGEMVALWVYNKYPDLGKTVLYFKNGILFDIQGPR